MACSGMRARSGRWNAVVKLVHVHRIVGVMVRPTAIAELQRPGLPMTKADLFRPEGRERRRIASRDETHRPNISSTRCERSSRRLELAEKFGGMVSALGLEPRTYRLKVRCSTS